jgi:hypothetical protein
MRASWKDIKNQLQWKNLRFMTLLVKDHLKRERLNCKRMTSCLETVLIDLYNLDIAITCQSPLRNNNL